MCLYAVTHVCTYEITKMCFFKIGPLSVVVEQEQEEVFKDKIVTQCLPGAA